MITAQKLLNELKALSDPDKADFYPKYFQARPGGYGEGDRFLGVTVPNVRKLSRQQRELPLATVEVLLASEWHEVRQLGLFILVLQHERAKSAERRDALTAFYLSQLAAVNNWDLIDGSAPRLLGEPVLRGQFVAEQAQLLRSPRLWDRRVAVLASLAGIRAGQSEPILAQARTLLSDPHDLIHKAVGWMLREMGKRDEAALLGFLDEHAGRMPRVMLRYAIEKLPVEQRHAYLQRRA
ncbi:DNA alkylation repair protein [Ferrimonas pelagia]|uniref:DNA alkylation repair protein n=1 Tax=Ferrimonas pelagia TaxID=1177826 RepID=A0ABP9FG06_9GAMM